MIAINIETIELGIRVLDKLAEPLKLIGYGLIAQAIVSGVFIIGILGFFLIQEMKEALK